MAFFRKWKTHYKHKKFTSDDALDGEDWGLGDQKKPTKDAKITDEVKLNLEGTGLEADDEEDNKPIFETYDIKYLGCTPVENKRSEKLTSEAIKTVIANAKAGSRKIKNQKRVKLNVSHDGIEILDHASDVSLMTFSIYKISYCSVDSANDHAFSFVGSEPDPLSDKEKFSLHVFICPKRKIAHEITLMVARCFENAYQNWRETVVQQQQYSNGGDLKVNSINNNNNSHITGDSKFIATAKEAQCLNNIPIRAEIHYSSSSAASSASADDDNNSLDNNNLRANATPQLSAAPLIDFAANDNANVDVRRYLQNTWVSFDDDMSTASNTQHQRIAAC